MARFVQQVWQAIAHVSQAWQIFLLFAPASFFAIMTALSAYAASLPLYLILVFASAVFCLVSLSVASIFHAMVRRENWKDLNTVEGKLDYVGQHIAADVAWDAKGKAKFFTKMNVGINLRNSANFSIAWKVKRFSSVVENTTPPHTVDFMDAVRISPPGTVLHTAPPAINLESLKKSIVKVRLEFEVVYGREGQPLEHTIKRKIEIDVGIDKSRSQTPNLKMSIAPREIHEAI